MRIRERLASRFGSDSVFTDIDSIPVGSDFFENINNEISTCDCLLAVIGPRWLSGGKDHPSIGIHEEVDYVRLEIEGAMHRKVPVIPVLVNGARMPRPSELPESIKGLAYRNAAAIDFWPQFSKRLGPDYQFIRKDHSSTRIKRYDTLCYDRRIRCPTDISFRSADRQKNDSIAIRFSQLVSYFTRKKTHSYIRFCNRHGYLCLRRGSRSRFHRPLSREPHNLLRNADRNGIAANRRAATPRFEFNPGQSWLRQHMGYRTALCRISQQRRCLDRFQATGSPRVFDLALRLNRQYAIRRLSLNNLIHAMLTGIGSL